MAGAVAVAVVAGLIVWHPWNPPCGRAARAARHLPDGHVGAAHLARLFRRGRPAHYLVLRDGTRIGEIPASQTSWTDQGLAPGMTHKYTIEASGKRRHLRAVGGRHGDDAYPEVAGRADEVGQQELDLGDAAVASVVARPGVEMAGYVIYNGTSIVDMIPGTSDTYTVGSLERRAALQPLGRRPVGRSPVGTVRPGRRGHAGTAAELAACQ